MYQTQCLEPGKWESWTAQERKDPDFRLLIAWSDSLNYSCAYIYYYYYYSSKDMLLLQLRMYLVLWKKGVLKTVQLIVEFFSVLIRQPKSCSEWLAQWFTFKAETWRRKALGTKKKMHTGFAYVQHRLDFPYPRFVFLGGDSAYLVITKENTEYGKFFFVTGGAGTTKKIDEWQHTAETAQVVGENAWHGNGASCCPPQPRHSPCTVHTAATTSTQPGAPPCSTSCPSIFPLHFCPSELTQE